MYACLLKAKKILEVGVQGSKLSIYTYLTYHSLHDNRKSCLLNNWQWRSQTISDGRAHYFYKILAIIYKHAGSYVHLLKGVVCMKMHTNSS